MISPSFISEVSHRLVLKPGVLGDPGTVVDEHMGAPQPVELTSRTRHRVHRSGPTPQWHPSAALRCTVSLRGWYGCVDSSSLPRKLTFILEFFASTRSMGRPLSPLKISGAIRCATRPTMRRARAAPLFLLATWGQIQGDSLFDECLERPFIDFLAIMNVDRTTGVTFEAGVKQA